MIKKFHITLLVIILGLLFFSGYTYSDSSKVQFIAELPSPGEFTLFANGGWTGNWYVGYNHGWVSELPPVKKEGFVKFYIGARIGRAKTNQQIKEVLSKNEESKDDIAPGPYSILIGVSGSKEERPEKGLILTKTDRIPMEGSAVAALENVGESRWFWLEIDKKLLSSDFKNYIHLWSNDKELNSVETAPILAGGVGSNDRENSYLFKIDGEKKDIKTIKFFEPALAIKFVGNNVPVPKVEISNFGSHPVDAMKQIIETEVSGDYITEVGVQLDSGSGWKNTEKVISNPPYNLIFNFKDLVPGKYKLRCFVKNWWEKISYSEYKTFSIEEETSDEK
jgi:hypothetical protein